MQPQSNYSLSFFSTIIPIPSTKINIIHILLRLSDFFPIGYLNRYSFITLFFWIPNDVWSLSWHLAYIFWYPLKETPSVFYTPDNSYPGSRQIYTLQENRKLFYSPHPTILPHQNTTSPYPHYQKNPHHRLSNLPLNTPWKYLPNGAHHHHRTPTQIIFPHKKIAHIFNQKCRQRL